MTGVDDLVLVEAPQDDGLLGAGNEARSFAVKALEVAGLELVGVAGAAEERGEIAQLAIDD